MNLAALIERSRRSRLSRWWLNGILSWKIPFNRPHGFRVEPLSGGGIRVVIPYWRINRNHIRGIHACAMATAAEYCSGLALLEKLDATAYRLIMKRLEMEYHYQAKANAHAIFVLGDRVLKNDIMEQLDANDAVLFTAVVEVHDVHKNHLATGRITWQVKAWNKVRTKA